MIVIAILNIAIPIFIFVLILGIVVLVHELGHFFMARRCGTFVEEFAMGMGPKLLAIRGKKRAQIEIEGEENVTLYTLRLFPIGGFCKMRGMEENMPDDPESLGNKSIFARVLVMAGGSLFNFALALLIFVFLALFSGYVTPTVSAVVPGSPGYRAGLQVGDRITHMNSTRVTLWENLRFTLDMNGGEPIDLRVTREGQQLTLQVTPELNAYGNYMVGFHPSIRVGFLDRHVVSEGVARAGILGSISNGVEMIGFNIRTPFRLLTRWISREPMPEGAGLQSVIGIAGDVTEVYQVTIQHGILPTVLTMLSIAGLISVALGTMNLLPIPALDGARLVFLAIEAVRRKPISQEKEGMVHFVGFIILIVLLVVVAYRDIVNLLPSGVS